jgi:5-methylcytosine-specific restriction protein A
MRVKLNKGDVINNEELIQIFKCSTQGGMRRSHKTNTLVLVSNHVKSIYSDRWFGKELHYTGMGSTGDQTLGAQNKTLHESNFNGVEVHLFEVFELRKYTYQGVVIYNGKGYQEKQADVDGNERKVWMFPLKLKDGKPISIDNLILNKLQETKRKSFRKLDKKQLKRIAESKKEKAQSYRLTETKSIDRDEYIKLYALQRAKGKCQLCEKPAPFLKKDGNPYLEVHHINYLANNGSDTIDNVAALCPNCHRKMHSLELQKDIDKLKEVALEKLEY